MNNKVKLLNDYYSNKIVICPSEDDDVFSIGIVINFYLKDNSIYMKCSSIIDISDDSKVDIYRQDDGDGTCEIELDEFFIDGYITSAEEETDDFLITEEDYLDLCESLMDIDSYIGKSFDKVSELFDYDDCEDLYSYISYKNFHSSYMLDKNATNDEFPDVIKSLKNLNHSFVSFMMDDTSYIGKIKNTKYNKNSNIITLIFDFVYIIEEDDIYCIDNFKLKIDNEYINSFINNINAIICDVEEIKKTWVALDLFDMDKKLKVDDFLSDVRYIFEDECELDEDDECSDLNDSEELLDDMFDDLFVNNSYFEYIDKTLTVREKNHLMTNVKKFYASGNYNKLEDYICGYGNNSNNYYNIKSFEFDFCNFEEDNSNYDYVTLYIPVTDEKEFSIEYKMTNCEDIFYVTKDTDINRLCNIILKIINNQIITKEDGHIRANIPQRKTKDKKILNLYVSFIEEYYGIKFNRNEIRLTDISKILEDMNKQLPQLVQ